MNDLFNHPQFKLKGKRLFECFAGVGFQRLALKDCVSVGISEVDKYAVQSYKELHGEVKNYGDISKIEKLPECDILTYSFPCTDLSGLGQQKGLNNTRSGLVYEVLRLLEHTKPTVLIMENVEALLSSKFIRQFHKIQYQLELLGYNNHTEILNSKDYGIPQSRPRVFMVSIRGGHYYFPPKQKLTKIVKNYLEVADEKYYLSQRFIDCIYNYKGTFPRIRNFELNTDRDVAACITTNEGQTCTSNFVTENGRLRKLTPRECWRLMGATDEQFNKLTCSDTQLYKQAGNGIVVDVMRAIYKQME